MTHIDDHTRPYRHSIFESKKSQRIHRINISKRFETKIIKKKNNNNRHPSRHVFLEAHTAVDMYIFYSKYKSEGNRIRYAMTSK